MDNLYKVLNRLCMMTALFCVTSVATSCDDDDTTAPIPEAAVKLEAGTTTEKSVSFKIIPSEADEVRYAVFAEGETIPSIEQLFKEGIAADASQTKSYTQENLEASTTYNIVAAARNAAGYSSMAQLQMTTDKQIFPATLELSAGTASVQSLSFKLTPAHATKVAYVCVKEGEPVPAAADILAKGTAADAAAAADYEVKDLLPRTTYQIAAVAEGETGLSEVQQISMTTLIPVQTVTLTAGEADVTSLTFTLASTDAAKVAYVCVKSDEPVPGATDILAKGTAAEAGKTVTCTVNDLTAETEYVIVAAASNLDGENPVASEQLKMTTKPVPFVKPHVGDFYYSDGTWSTELNPAKTPIGIVFYLGVASKFKDSASLYKQKDGKTAMGKINGYVIALQDATLVDGQNNDVWWSFFDGNYPGTCSSDLEDFRGYSNTLSIVDMANSKYNGLSSGNDNFPATYYATVAYEKACPAPETSSGWFLPSAYQFKYIYDYVYFNKDEIKNVWLEKSFETLGDKATPLYVRDSEYWTSTEKYDSSGCSYWAYYFCFDSSMLKPGFITDFRKNGGNRVRSMLVF